MMHEDILKKMTIERGKIGERNVKAEAAREIANRLIYSALGLGIALVLATLLRWVLQ